MKIQFQTYWFTLNIVTFWFKSRPDKIDPTHGSKFKSDPNFYAWVLDIQVRAEFMSTHLIRFFKTGYVFKVLEIIK